MNRLARGAVWDAAYAMVRPNRGSFRRSAVANFLQIAAKNSIFTYKPYILRQSPRCRGQSGPVALGSWQTRRCTAELSNFRYRAGAGVQVTFG